MTREDRTIVLGPWYSVTQSGTSAGQRLGPEMAEQQGVTLGGEAVNKDEVTIWRSKQRT